MLHIQQLQGCASLVDHGECGCVGGIVVAVEGAVVDGEPVGPEVQNALDALGWAGDAGAWIVYYAGFCAFAAEGDAAAGEAGAGGGFFVIAAGTGEVPMVDVLDCTHTLSCGCET